MMKGIGIDIVEVGRIARLARDGKFLKKIYTEEEIIYCGSKKNSAQHYAVRFAAKEAVWKALKKRSRGLTHRDIGIRNDSDGRPRVYIKNRPARGVTISLTHTKEYAAAFCVVE
ncbi:MAG: holo-ACP synthase [Endomicrobiia bacterium]|nr:holo-ACP synthase [Endomicrobiia bacterium]